jgi:hypothetical protein
MGAPRAAHRTARLVAVFALCVCTASTMLAATRSVHGDNAAPAPIVLDVEAVLRGVNFDLATTDGNGGTRPPATACSMLPRWRSSLPC